MSNESLLSTRIKELRISMGLTQKDFAELINVSTVSVSSYETGAKTPSLDMVINIAQKCNVSIDWLCGFSQKKSLGTQIITYADAFRILISICSTKYENEDSAILFPSQLEDRDNGDMLFVVSEDDNFCNFFTEWKKMYDLYTGGTIDEELYNMWISKELVKYEKPLNHVPF